VFCFCFFRAFVSIFHFTTQQFLLRGHNIFLTAGHRKPLPRWSPALGLIQFWAIHKRHSAKNWHPPTLSEKFSHWLNPPCPCGHTINFKKFEVFCSKKCGCPNPPLSEKCPLTLQTSFMDSPLLMFMDNPLLIFVSALQKVAHLAQGRRQKRRRRKKKKNIIVAFDRGVAGGGGGGGAPEKIPKNSKKIPKSSTIKPLSTISVPCTKIYWRPRPLLPPAADAHGLVINLSRKALE